MRYHLQHIPLFVREYVKINFNIRLVTTTEKVQCKQELCNRKSNRGGKIAKLPQPLISLVSFKFAWLPQSDDWFSPSKLNFHLNFQPKQAGWTFIWRWSSPNVSLFSCLLEPYVWVKVQKDLVQIASKPIPIVVTSSQVHRRTHPQNCILPCCVAFLCQFVQCNWWSVPEGSKGRKL